MKFDIFKKYTEQGEGVLICTDTNRRYFTSFASSLGYLLILKNEKILFLDGRYYIAGKEKVSSEIKVVLLENLFGQLNDIIKKESLKLLYLESDITVADFEKFKDKINCTCTASVNLSNEILELRSVKTEAEINQIIKAQRIAEKALDNVLDFIKPGITEKEIALQLDYEMRKQNGCTGISFDTICVSGTNSALPHGVPGEKKICEGDFVTMDFGALAEGYHSDMTRTVAVSYATDEMYSVYETVLSAQNRAIDAVKSGKKCSDIDDAARSYIYSRGYEGYFNHSTGHGVGLDIHEFPFISGKNDKILKENQIITCEPGIYIEGKFGVRIEDMVLVKNNSSQNLTKAAKMFILLK